MPMIRILLKSDLAYVLYKPVMIHHVANRLVRVRTDNKTCWFLKTHMLLQLCFSGHG